MRILFRFFALAAVVIVAVSAAASAADSVYTSVDIEECLQLTPPHMVEEMQGAEWVCPGHNGYVVWVGEGDLRYFLGYGPSGRDQCSYGQTLSAWNTINTTLEWRLHNGRPFATILRYTAEGNGEQEQYLVVSKVGDDGSACHMAYVSAREPNHNQLARDAADRFAVAFECDRDRAFNYTRQGRSQAQTPGTNSSCPGP